jgi:hypothetical protein
MSTPNPAPTFAGEVMAKAIADIDAQFEVGYAKAHPDLVGTYMTVEATLRGQNVGTP